MSPVYVPASVNANVSSVASGGEHVCALKDGGEIVCWGDTSVFTGGINQVAPPIDLPAAIAVAAGVAHVCALLTNSHVQCWGWNGDGQTSIPSSLATEEVVELDA